MRCSIRPAQIKFDMKTIALTPRFAGVGSMEGVKNKFFTNELVRLANIVPAPYIPCMKVCRLWKGHGY